MHLNSFARNQRNLPGAANSERAALGFERWNEAVENDIAGTITGDEDTRRLLEALFGNSPFLTQCAVTDPAFTQQLLTDGPDAVHSSIKGELELSRIQNPDFNQLASALRAAKRKLALTAAVADISGAWSLEKVMESLSDFAEASLALATAHQLRQAARNGALKLSHEDNPERDSGLIILAMGKMGGRELNYSSDIDLIVFYDPEKIQTDSPDRLQNNMVRMTRDIMRLMEERTADGYVFRTDLRLRPDPGATPLAIPLPAAETYYETLGQNWERAAMIKARPVAGDREAGAAFIKWLEPFIWRKNLDFATIQDIQSIKRQINTQRNFSGINLAGHNIKLGHGGIREIEFYTQTQQLIWGGRQPDLRGAATTEVLRRLEANGQITPEAADKMVRAYRFLRTVEHRLQMIDDEQTHSLPQDEQGLRDLAVFLGYGGVKDFASQLLEHLGNVEALYADLFNENPSLGVEGVVAGNLMFTGGDPDPETLKTLERLGYAKPGMVDETVRKWHHGRYRSTRSARSRGILTELMPLLLKSLAETSDADTTFLKFDEFLSKLPSGVQLFSMLFSNPHLLDLMAEIMGEAPRLAEHLSRNPSILDSVLSNDFFDPPPPGDELDAELEHHLERAETLEDKLDDSRRWANDRKFQVGIQTLRGHLPPRTACEALSNLADSALGRLQSHMEAEFAARHGVFPNSGMVTVAMGKLGGREMTPVSDLDLIFVYATDPSDEASDGPRPLSPSQYFSRQSQRLINAVTAQTTEGRLYEVDMRLRPSGKAGPIASSYQAFAQYQHKSAWTWEHMALTRARVIAGPDELRQKVETTIRHVLTKPRDAAKLLADVAEMRARMDKERHTDFIWEIKHLRGGLVDIEFIAQYLQLLHAHDHAQVLSVNTREAMEHLQSAGLLEERTADELIEALDLWQMIQLMLRLTIIGRLLEAPAEGFQNHLAELAGAASPAQLRQKIIDTAKRTHDHYIDLIETPAKAL